MDIAEWAFGGKHNTIGPQLCPAFVQTAFYNRDCNYDNDLVKARKNEKVVQEGEERGEH